MSSMTDSVTTIAKQFVVVSDTQPSSPFEGQFWIDSSTASNTAYQYRGGSFQQLGQNLSQIYNFMNDQAAIAERHDLELSLNAWNFDDGFIDIFWDQSKIASSTDTVINAGTNGNVELGYSTSGVTSGSEKVITGDDASNWGGNTTVTYDLTLSETAFVYRYPYRYGGGDSDLAPMDQTVTIKDSSNNVLAQVTETLQSDDFGVDQWITIPPSEYSRIPGNETLTLEISTEYSRDNWAYVTATGTISVSYGSIDADSAGSMPGHYNDTDIVELAKPARKTSGSITHTRKDIGFTPNKIVATPEIDASDSGESVSMIVRDNSGNSVTLQQADFDSEIGVSFNDGNLQIEPQLSGDGSSSPTLKKTKLLGVQ